MAARRNEALGVKVKRILQERHISQSAFSQRTRIKPHQLSRLLSGQRRFGLPAIEASAHALQMSPEQLAEGTKELALVKGTTAEPTSRGTRKRGAAAQRTAQRERAPQPERERAPEVQMSRAQVTSLQIANRELTQRLSELESQLSTSEKQCQMLRQRAEQAELRVAERAPRRGHLATRPAAKGRVFGAALFAGLLGLGLRAVRRAA